MTEAELPAYLDAIRHMHGCAARYVKTVPAREVFQGVTPPGCVSSTAGGNF